MRVWCGEVSECTPYLQRVAGLGLCAISSGLNREVCLEGKTNDKEVGVQMTSN